MMKDPLRHKAAERVYFGEADGTGRPTAHIITCGVPLRLASSILFECTNRSLSGLSHLTVIRTHTLFDHLLPSVEEMINDNL
jgi:hypothetical protein